MSKERDGGLSISEADQLKRTQVRSLFPRFVFVLVVANNVTPSAFFIDKRSNKYVGKRACNKAGRNPKNAARACATKSVHTIRASSSGRVQRRRVLLRFHVEVRKGHPGAGSAADWEIVERCQISGLFRLRTGSTEQPRLLGHGFLRVHPHDLDPLKNTHLCN